MVISRVGFGTGDAAGMSGGSSDDTEIVRTIHAGLDAGMNWIDTAELYGPHRAEELVARAIRGREDVYVFTKVAPRLVFGDTAMGSGFERAGIRAGAEGSLRRLGREVIDLYMLHFAWPDVPVEESWGSLTELVDDGLVRAIGVSNFDDVALIERCERVRHVDAVENHFSLLRRRPLDEVLPYCQANGTVLLGYGPLAFGVLSGGVTKDTTFAAGDWRAGNFPLLTSQYDDIFAGDRLARHIEITDVLRPIAERLGITLAELALAWVTNHEGVAAITGTRSAAHAASSAAAGRIILARDELAEIEAVVAR